MYCYKWKKQVPEKYVLCDSCDCKDECISSDVTKSRLAKAKARKLIAIFMIVIILVAAGVGGYFLFKKDTYTYTLKSDGTYSIKSYNGNEKNIIIPEKYKGKEVTEISRLAFENKTQIESVYIPKTIKAIRIGAFYGCTSIREMTLPFIGTNYHGEGRLQNIFNPDTYNLTQFEVPPSIKKIVLLDSCTIISIQAFYMCDSLQEVYIPQSVSIIHDGSSKTWDGENPPNRIEFLPFYNCSPDLKLYCEATSEPTNWQTKWNYINETTALTPYWGVAYTGAN